jgi:hypothetical protein
MPLLEAGGTQNHTLVINGTGHTQSVSAPTSSLSMTPDAVTVANG